MGKISKKEIQRYIDTGWIFERRPNEYISLDTGEVIKTKEEIKRIIKNYKKGLKKY